MTRFGQVGRLKPDMVETYRRLHAAVWPQVLTTIQACNLGNYSIFLLGDQVFARFDYHGQDYPADMEKMAADPVTQQWWQLTKPCFLHHEEQSYYQDMEEIFYFR